MDEDGALFDSRFDGGGPFRVTPESGGVSLESALRDFGPAAIDDLIPRLSEIAGALDRAHADGAVHGALHPSKVFVYDQATRLIAGKVAIAPYAAPEVAEGGAATAASDQYSLAVIIHEWLFGRPIAQPADRPVDVHKMPGVDRAALSRAFTRALARNPRGRFQSCTEFCHAVAASTTPELPLLAIHGDDDLDDDDPVGPFLPEHPVEPYRDDAMLAGARPTNDLDDFHINTEEPIAAASILDPQHDDALLARDPGFDAAHDDAVIGRDAPFEAAHDDVLHPTERPADLDAINPIASQPVRPVPSWNASAAATSPRSSDSQKFGGLALILATLVGAIFGFAAGYMARPRALQSGPPPTITRSVPTDTEPGIAQPASPASAAARPAPSAPNAPQAPGAARATAAARPESGAPTAASLIVGRLLVRSTPSGASVSIDGVPKGTTPLALTDLPTGSVNVVVARRGYISETRKVLITSARPARSVDVRLAPDASAAAGKGPSGGIARSPAAAGAPRPSTPATLGKPAVATGSLNVDSRPAGAAVTINGQPRGNTPLTLNDLAPGEYRILMSMPGYRNFTTTVRVVAGERVRAAASLTALEQQ